MTLNLGIMAGVLSLRHGWLRVFGVGIAWKDTRVVPQMFSERVGAVRVVRVGPWSFRWLWRRS